MEQKIYSYMLSIGLRPKCSGYKYIFDLVKMQILGSNILPLKLNGYEILAKKYGKTVSAIDKNIQNCISKAWLDGDVDDLYKEFGNTIDIDKGKPTSKQLIMHIYDRISSV
ncbi:MAG: sporulation initiation factor Spo0A C-terminal domain-containing protein [Clostridia bacterium]|nr:sporulation initiation factor Spo0A C-terminal domain-containing protein [Clostridia bacterium]